ncbi:MAG: glycoside hydrolase family 3 C-terminal domain-containing protein [Thermofilaceae archaeon]|nr:glycoside hydrolase family 3 C-terminal domain-containing protein [Thermofilaceae archaeon]MCX8180923.1 glycoside hydrolase family 3 C-terminal domain-containing protein [Thermofilaceae archaeon]MDW8003488.1 glycoside hydrolase family 3 N-terminal domain-containing protein [Thermofilaceae archaeon]
MRDSKGVEARVEQLLSKMTLEEKVSQLLSIPIESLVDGNKFSKAKAEDLLKHGIGQITRVSGSRLALKPREAASLVNAVQRFLVEETRMGIPAIVHEESLAGLLAATATCFPQAIALASSWDPDLVYRVACEIRRQVMIVGARHCLAPVLDLCWDPRWGRCEETYGEDPYLSAAMGVAYVRGLQGDLRNGVVATGKHFAGHGFPEGGRNVAPVRMGEREFRETSLYTFEAAVKEGGLMSVMPAYHEIDGIPCHANKWLLTRVLREEWGFKGIVVSDYMAVRQLQTFHAVAADELEAALKALEAGVDIELPGVDCFKRLIDAVKGGVVSEKKVEEATARVLRLKLMLGLLDNPYVDEGSVPDVLDGPDARLLALEAARKSLILLKNKGILPLSQKALAVVGPCADDPLCMLGDYHYAPHVGLDKPAIEVVTVLEGVRRVAPPDVKVYYARGCGLLSSDKSGFKEAVEAAEKSEIVVAVLGERSGGFWLPGREQCSGEGLDRCELSLPGVQEEFLKELLETGKPVVVVLTSGRPLALPQDVLDKVDALLQAWYPGEEGGTAIAEALFGFINPGGRLPISVPKCTGQVPVYYRRKPSSYNRYVEADALPLYPFGFGLSYTEFSFRDIGVEPSEVRPGVTLNVSVTVENVGRREGDEVVQLYVSRSNSSVTRPVRELKGFKRVTLKPGEKVRVTFKLPVDLLAYYDTEMKLSIEKGEYCFIVAKHAGDAGLQATVKVPESFSLPERRKLLSESFVGII